MKWITGSGTHGCWLGSYEYRKRLVFEKVVHPGAVVFDIGANVGYYTLLASVLVGPSGQVIAFEPLPRNLDFLKQHLSLNRIANARVIAAAVADRAGAAAFDEGNDPHMGRLSPHGKVQVDRVTIDSLVVSSAVPVPDCMKIDVEGGEVDVLLGASNTLALHHPTVFLATHGDCQREQSHGLLKSAGYQVRPIGAGSCDVSDEIVAWHDVQLHEL